MLPDWMFPVVGFLIMIGLGWWTIAPNRPVAPTPSHREIDTERLEKIAAIPIEEIIAAAERRATHPDEPEPKVLADLDPATWAKPSAPQVGGERRPQVPDRPSGVLAPGMVVISPSGLDKFGERLIERLNSSSRSAIVIENGMEWRDLGSTEGVYFERQSAYADCQHETAEREEVRALGSDLPVRAFVASCDECDRQALRRQLKDLTKRIQEVLQEVDMKDGSIVFPEDLHRHYRRLVDDANEIKKQIVALDTKKSTEEWGAILKSAYRAPVKPERPPE